jgi:DNA-binding MarR family transcriptional regulator
MKSRWRDEREMRAWWAFLYLWRGLAAGMERQLADAGVSGADYQLLAPLAETPEQPMRPRDLAAATGWDRSRLAHQLRRMEQRGLIAREDCVSDARGTLVRLTDSGRDALRRAEPGHVEWVRTHFTGLLTADELDTLTAVSERVVAGLDQRS